MDIPLKDIQEEITYLRTVRIGDVIKSPQFKNLLYRDLIDQDPMVGFKVNPMKTGKLWNNTRLEIVESPGFIQRKFLKKNSDLGKIEKQHIQLKIAIDPEREFVVIFTFRSTEHVKEYIDEDDRSGHYPLTVVAKMLSPAGEWDENGLELWYTMESEMAKHCVNEVISCGFMNFSKQRVF